jgi:hypothetical protein
VPVSVDRRGGPAATVSPRGPSTTAGPGPLGLVGTAHVIADGAEAIATARRSSADLAASAAERDAGRSPVRSSIGSRPAVSSAHGLLWRSHPTGSGRRPRGDGAFDTDGDAGGGDRREFSI